MFSNKLPTWEFSCENYFPIWLHFEILPLPSGSVCAHLLFSLLPSFLPSSHFPAQPYDYPSWRRTRGAQQKRGDPGRWTASSKVWWDRTAPGRGNNLETTRRGKIGGWVKQQEYKGQTCCLKQSSASGLDPMDQKKSKQRINVLREWRKL